MCLKRRAEHEGIAGQMLDHAVSMESGRIGNRIPRTVVWAVEWVPHASMAGEIIDAR
jgi:hypothetical protein